jgi:ABC-type bacteriocin/lantibiotic exporter with double-glycine peptidase domain
MGDIDLRWTFSSPTLEGLWGLKPVLAEEDWMCGAAALTAVLNHIPIHVNQSQVASGTDTAKPMGTPWKGILKYAGGKRLRATATKETPDIAIKGLVRERRYVLIDWGDKPGHWVLACGWEGTTGVIVFMDPCRRPSPFFGMKWDDFCTFWNQQNRKITRIAIALHPVLRNTRSAKGLEDRTWFAMESWTNTHVPRSNPHAPKPG